MTVRSVWKPASIVLLTGIMAALVLLHIKHVNGPFYWTWSWRRLPFWPLYVLMLAAALPFAAAQYAYARWKRAGIALTLIAFATLLLQLAAMYVQPPAKLERMILIIESPNAQYCADARSLASQTNISMRDWMPLYPQLLPSMHMHAKYKPPGLVLYFYALIQLLGTSHAPAVVGGILIGVAAALAGPATYWLLKFFTRQADSAFCGASFIALTPSLILFWPQFDQVYVTMACVLVVLWQAALIAPRIGPGIALAIAFGLVLGIGSFASYTLLTLGVTLALQTLLFIADTKGTGLGRAGFLSIVVAATIVIGYWIFWLITGFDPIATYLQITGSLGHDMVGLARPFPQHMPFDLLDVLLGLGWIGGLIAAFAIWHMGRGIVRLFAQGPHERLTFLALAQLLVVTFTAILPGETARTYMLYFPLFMAPIGWELSRWSGRARFVTYACLLLITIVIAQNMVFLYMGPELDGPRW